MLAAKLVLVLLPILIFAASLVLYAATGKRAG